MYFYIAEDECSGQPKQDEETSENEEYLGAHSQGGNRARCRHLNTAKARQGTRTTEQQVYWEEGEKNSPECFRSQDSYGFTFTYGKFAFLVIIFITQDISKVFKSSKGLRIPKGLDIAFESNIISALHFM